MKIRGIRRVVIALVLGTGVVTAFHGAQQQTLAAAPVHQKLAGEAMPPIPQLLAPVRNWKRGQDWEQDD